MTGVRRLVIRPNSRPCVLNPDTLFDPKRSLNPKPEPKRTSRGAVHDVQLVDHPEGSDVVKDLRFRVKDLGFRVKDLGFRLRI